MADEKLDTQIRREQIAEAALGVVASQGIRRLSVAAVARRVGLVPSGIYRHFKSKDEIIDAVLDLLEKRVLAIIEVSRQETDDPLERLRSVLRRHVRFIREGRAIPRLVFSDDVHSNHPERKAQVCRIMTNYLSHVAEFVRDGQAAGQIRPEIDPQTTALMFFGMIMPAGLLWHLTDGGIDVTQHAERAWHLFHRAVTSDGA
jgi:AcrR family transcriptional regulator